MKFQNLTIIGTSHIAKESLTTIQKAFDTNQPDIVAVELDHQRLHALLSGGSQRLTIKDISRVGLKGYLFAQLGAWAEHKLGESVGMKPGADMLSAVRLATHHRKSVALIDQPIEVTLKEFSRHLSWKEKGRLLWDILKAVFGPTQQLPFDLRTIPKPHVVKKLTLQVAKRYPHIYKVLVTDRNAYMAERLAHIIDLEPQKIILAVLGAGHSHDVLRLVKARVLAKTIKNPR